MQEKKNILVLFVMVVLFVSIWFWLYSYGQTERVPQEILLSASMLYFLCCFPAITYFFQGDTRIPYLPIVGFFYFMYFGVSSFINYNLVLGPFISITDTQKALNLSVLGLFVLYLGFYLPVGGVIFSPLLRPVRINCDSKKLFHFAAFLGIVGNISMWYMNYNTYAPVLGGIVFFLCDLGKLGIAALFLLQLKNKLPFRGKCILWLVLFLPKLVLSVGSGFLFPVIFDFLVLFCVYVDIRRKIPWVRVAIVIILIFFMSSVKAEFRRSVWLDRNGKYNTVSKKAGYYFDLLYGKLTSNVGEGYKKAYEELAVRTDYLVTYAKVVSLTPKVVPYWNGYSYRTFIPGFIPRIFWPYKAYKTLGQDFGHRYNLIDFDDRSTSYNFPYPIEMYVNFGEIGVVIGMFIIGFIFRVINIIFNHRESGDGGAIVSLVTFINLLAMESDFSLVFGNIAQYAFLLYLLIKRTRIDKAKNEGLLPENQP